MYATLLAVSSLRQQHNMSNHHTPNPASNIFILRTKAKMLPNFDCNEVQCHTPLGKHVW